MLLPKAEATELAPEAVGPNPPERLATPGLPAGLARRVFPLMTPTAFGETSERGFGQ